MTTSSLRSPIPIPEVGETKALQLLTNSDLCDVWHKQKQFVSPTTKGTYHTLKSVHFIESVRRLFPRNEEAREEGHMFLPLPPAGNMSDTGPLQRTSLT